MIIKYFNWYMNFTERKRKLQERGCEFVTKQGFSMAEIEWEGRKLQYKFERLPMFYMGYRSKLLSIAKKKCGGDYGWTSVFKGLEVSQRQIYKNKIHSPYGFYIDMKNAYTTILHILGLIPQDIFLKMLDLKAGGHNINRILGISYLGKKSVITWLGHKEVENKLDVNPATGIFYLARYLVHKLFIELHKDDLFRKVMLARFIDCCIVADKYSSEQYINRMRYVFTDVFIRELKKIDEYVYKNAGFSFFSLFDLELRDDFYKCFQFHCYPVGNIKYSESGNTRELSFYVMKEHNKWVKKVYKSGALSESVAERFTFTSASMFKPKDVKNFDNVYFIDIYQLLDKHQINYKIHDFLESNKEKCPIFVPKIEDFIESNIFNLIDYEGLQDITQAVSVEF